MEFVKCTVFTIIQGINNGVHYLFTLIANRFGFNVAAISRRLWLDVNPVVLLSELQGINDLGVGSAKVIQRTVS